MWVEGTKLLYNMQSEKRWKRNIVESVIMCRQNSTFLEMVEFADILKTWKSFPVNQRSVENWCLYIQFSVEMENCILRNEATANEVLILQWRN